MIEREPKPDAGCCLVAVVADYIYCKAFLLNFVNILDREGWQADERTSGYGKASPVKTKATQGREEH